MNDPAAEPPVRPLDELATVRRSYDSDAFTEESLAGTWLEQLRLWYGEAAGHPQILESNAMQIATVDAQSRPDVRTVLARGFDADGIVFFTNYASAKGDQLAANPFAAGLFAWLPMARQVRFRGPVRRVDRAETEAYFASRPGGAQLAAWASPQSEVIADRSVLDARLEEVTARFAGKDISAPPFWGGYRIAVTEIEFWQGRQFRLHDRLRFRTTPTGWIVERLAP